MTSFTREQLHGYTHRIEALIGMDPQVAFGLLRTCVASAPIFLAQTTPPLLTHELFEEFDNKMVECAWRLLTLPGHEELVCDDTRRERARQRLGLPIRQRGVGIAPVSLRHALAYFSSVAACVATDEKLAGLIQGLERFAADTHTRVLQVLGPTSHLTQAVEPIICRTDPQVLLRPQYFMELLANRDDARLQRALTHAAQAVRAQTLLHELSTRSGMEAEHDLIAACSADRSARIFAAPLSDRYNRLTPFEFVCWTRRFLQLPPLSRLGNAATREGFSYELEECTGHHSQGDDALIDLHGSHDNSRCGPASHGMHTGHTLFKRVIRRFAGMVPGVQCDVEPKTSDVLLGQFSDAQCRQLFLKRPSKELAMEIQGVVNELDAINRLVAGDDRDARVRAVTARMSALNIANSKQEKKAVRLDLRLRYLSDELLVDVTFIHSLAKSHRAAELKRTRERLLSDVKAVKGKPAAAIDKARAAKFQSYNHLLCVIKKQVADKRRHKEPVFTPAVVTTFGELGPGCTMVQEWLAMRLKEHLTMMGERPDGLTTPYLVGKFRADFRLALVMCAVKRAAAMQLGSGLPSGCVRGDWGLLTTGSAVHVAMAS